MSKGQRDDEPFEPGAKPGESCGEAARRAGRAEDLALSPLERLLRALELGELCDALRRAGDRP